MRMSDVDMKPEPFERKPKIVKIPGKFEPIVPAPSRVEEDEVVMEYDVVVCNGLPNTDMYRVQFPHRKKKVFDEANQPRIRFKKNVKCMEVRLAADVLSGSYDANKVAKPTNSTNGTDRNDAAQLNGTGSKMDDIYEGRAFSGENPLQYAVGFVRGGKLYVNPVSGSFDMHRSLAALNQKGKTEEDGPGGADESDSETPAASGSQQLRVKFARPETDRQKKRREASALHREKMIANDPWIGMNVHLKGDKTMVDKLNKMTPTSVSTRDHADDERTEMRELVQKAIICGKLEQLDLSRDQLMSHQRIRDLPDHLQIKAQLLKSRVIDTDSMASLVSPSLTRSDLIDGLKRCAHLVRGVWVLNSEFLFSGLPPAHSNVPGKVDENRSELWRKARDLALCLIDAGHRVTRYTLSRCFHLNSKDAEEVLSTFGVRGDRTWQLKVPSDEAFMQSPDNLPLILEQRKYWVERWQELQPIIDRSISPKRQRRQSGRGSPMKAAEQIKMDH